MLGLLLAAALSQTVAYPGPCDASAAVAISSTLFLVANDEDNVLRAYRLGQPAPPVYSLDLSRFLATDPNRPEVDLEAAAPVGKRIYWIASHSTNGKGKASPSRRRFFATDVSVVNDQVTLTTVGQPYTDLVQAFEDTPALRDLQLAQAATIAPELPGGLNIEGLSATPTRRVADRFPQSRSAGQGAADPAGKPRRGHCGPGRAAGRPHCAGSGRARRAQHRVRGRAAGIPDRGRDRPATAVCSASIAGPGIRWTHPALFRALTSRGCSRRRWPAAPDGQGPVWIFSDDGSRLLDDGKACKNSRAGRQSFRGISVPF